MSYVITSQEAAEGVWNLGTPVGYVTDALTGNTVATFRNSSGNYVRFPLDVALCEGCDEPVIENACPTCDSLAPVVRIAPGRIAA